MTEEIKNYTTYDIDEALIAKSSLLNDFENYTDNIAFESEFEGAPAGNILFGGMQIRKKKYADDTDGIWIGIDRDGIAKANIGNASQYFKWDGSTLDLAGSITATSGTIGGWTIGATSLTGGDVELDSLGNIYVGNQGAGDYIQLSGADNAIYHYDNGEIRTFIANGLLGFNSPTGATAASIFGLAGGQLFFDVGTVGYFMSDVGFFPDSSGLTLGAPSQRWLNFYVDNYVIIKSGGIILEETGAGTDTVTLEAPSSISTSFTLTLPNSDGNAGEVLQTDGNGFLSWASGGGANTALSNLTVTSVNQSLIPSAGTQDLGSSGSPWDDLWIDEIRLSSNGEFRYNGDVAFDFSTSASAIYVGSPGLTQFNPYTHVGVNMGDVGERFNTIYCDTLDELSDIRVKKNVRPSRYGLEALLKLETIEYEAFGKKRVGFSAQDVAKVIPEITKNTEPTSKIGTASIVRTDLIPVLVQAVKELTAEIRSKK